MTANNIRRLPTESYNPKQRIVGGIVLFLLMLFIYMLLKILLGISSVPDNTYALRDPLPDEIFKEDATAVRPPTTTGTGKTPTNTTTAIQPTAKLTRPLPLGFVFLDINGNPMQREANQPELVVAPPVSTGEKWIVQAGSFAKEKQAHQFAKKLKDLEINAEVVKVGKRHTVRLPPKDSRQAAEQQLAQLREKVKIKGLVKKIEQ